MECTSEDLKHHHKKVQIKSELEKRQKEWQQLVVSFKELKQITDNSYPQYEHLIKYLDNEDLLKTDLSVVSPAHYVS